MKRIGLATVITGLVLAGMVGFAAVTFDPSTGTGFVGKGDVQFAFGWNNAQLQKYATEVTFTYRVDIEYEVVEVWATGNPENPRSWGVRRAKESITYKVAATLDGDPRQVKGQKQFTGFILNGFIGQPIFEGEEPPTPDVIVWIRTCGTYEQGKQEYELCMDLPYDEQGALFLWKEGAGRKAVESVTILSQTGGLYVTWGGQSVLIWQP